MSIDWKALGLREPDAVTGNRPAYEWHKHLSPYPDPLRLFRISDKRDTWRVTSGNTKPARIRELRIHQDFFPTLESAAAHLRKLGCGLEEA